MNYLQQELYELVRTNAGIFRFIQEGSLDGLWYWDMENPGEEWMDEKFWQVLGYDPAKMPHKASAWQDIIYPQDLELAKEKLQKHLADPNHPYDQLVRYRHKNGSTVWIRCRGLAIRNAQGQPIRMIGAHTDMTELYQERELARVEAEKYEAILDNQNIYVVKIDRDGNYAYVNDFYCREFGWKPEKLLGTSSAEGIIEEDLPKCISVGQKAFANPGVCFEEVLTKHTERGLMTGLWEFRALTNPDGEPKELLAIGFDITARTEAEKKLHESETRLRFIAENTSDGIMLFEGGKITYVSPAYERILGYTLEEEKQRTADDIYALLHEQDRERVRNFITKKIREQAESFQYRYRAKHKKGHYVWREDQANMVYDEAGIPVRSVLVARDISERVESEMRVATTMNSLDELIFVLDAQGVFREIYYDPEKNKLLVEPQEFIGKAYREVLPGALAEHLDQTYAHKDDPEPYEYQYSVTLDKQRYHYHAKAIQRTNLEGNFAGFTIISRNVTRQVEAERKLQRIGHILEKAGEMSRIGTWQFDIASGNLEWSAITREIHEVESGYVPEISSGIDFYKEGEDRERLRACFEHLAATGESYDEEFEIITAKGNHKWVRVIGMARMENGQCVEAYGTFQDITEAKKQHETLRQAQKRAEAGSQAKSEFLANMSHEIRTPLNSVIGFTDLLLKTELSASQQSYMGYVNHSANALLDLINDILDFSKIEAGKLELNIERVDLWELAQQIVDIVRYKTNEKGLELMLHISPRAPQFVYADPVRLRQVLINLLGNAVKFTQKGFVRLEIREVPSEHSKSTQRSFYFSVQDSGKGIEEERQKRIFEAFAQEDASTTRHFGGTGLGLSISNSLLQLMNSAIKLESKVGVGSNFSFTLDLQTDRGNILETLTTEQTLEQIQHVLIVDDEPRNGELLQEMLAVKDIPCTVVHNGIEALSWLAKNTADIIIMDYHMPFMNGLNVVEKIRNELKISPSQASILLLHSVANDIELMDTARSLKIQKVCNKPITMVRLYTELVQLKKNTPGKIRQMKSSAELVASGLSYRILLVDDNSINLALARNMLQTLWADLEIIEAGNGKAALESYGQHPPDLILMDVQMPEMSGYEATQAIREKEILHQHLHTPIIALTAGATKGEKERCLAAGMDDYLSKPIVLDKLKETIEKWLSNQPINSPAASQSQTISPELQHFNREELETMLGNKAGALDEVLELVRNGFLLGLIEKLEAAIRQKADEATIRSLAHQVVGAASSLRFERMAYFARELEELPSLEQEKIQSHARQICAEYQVVKQLIDEVK